MPTAHVDEETPLLPHAIATPLPWTQLSIVLFIQLAEPLTSNVITPFAPQVIRDVGVTRGHETQVGHYVGILISIFYVAQAMTILHWGRLSDLIGRKPVILVGLSGAIVSMLLFGISKTFAGLILSRCLSGALSGNVGVIKSMMAELTDETNIAQAFAYLPIPWCVGSIVGPMIGGMLSHPAEQFPDIFKRTTFFKTYPYFLACAVPAACAAIFWLVVTFFLEETVSNPTPISHCLFFRRPTSCSLASVSNADRGISGKARHLSATAEPIPFRQLLTYRVVVVSANYALLAFCDISFKAVQPVFLSTPLELGGLGLAPSVIGQVMSISGIVSGVFQVMFFAKIHRLWGSRKTYLVGISSALVVFATFPILSALVRKQGLSSLVWVVVMFQAITPILLNMSYGVIYMYVAAASPDPASVGATTGLGQMTASIFRAIGPAIGNSLYSLSLSEGYMGGLLVYYVLMTVAAFSIVIGTLLPHKLSGMK